MLPSPPDSHAIGVMVLTVIAFVLFTRDRIPIQTTSLFVIIALALGFHLFPYEQDDTYLKYSEFFLGFGHEALITICALMIMGHGLVRTGALEPLARVFSRTWTSSPSLSLLLVLLTCVFISGFINDTPVVILVLPILISIALRTKTLPSKTLMPMNFAVLIGGMGTTIGTSTNLLVVSIAADLGGPRFGLFDFTHITAIAAIGGILYLWQIAPRLLPDRIAPLADTSPRIFNAMLYINDNSFAHGKTITEVLQKTGKRMAITRIQRGTDLTLVRLPTSILRSGDRLFISDTPENLKEYEHILGATLYNSAEDSQPISKDNPLASANQQLAEIVVTAGSLLNRRTLNQVGFIQRYNLIPLAIHRTSKHTVFLNGQLADTVFRVGDILLVQGSKEQIKALKQDKELLVLDATMDLPHTQKAPLALFLMLGVILAAATKILPISISALLGAGLMLLTGCLNWRDTGRALSSQVILIIVASLALGTALMRTGGTDYLAQLFVQAATGLSPEWTVSALILLMSVLSNFVSNNAAAVIGTPVAIGIATQLNVAAEPFVLAILFGANLSFATPMAYQTNLIVMNAAGYKFGDFVRVGLPLTILMWLTFSVLLAFFYPA